jgi:Rieske 2Fe-2S family protein
MSRLTKSVPYAVDNPTQIPARRYYDQAFYDLECKNLWSRVWQMACRLEEIPKMGDYVEYQILDQSVIVVRVDDTRVKGYYNACRHRGRRLVSDRGNVRHGFSCPFHGWSYGLEGRCSFIYQPSLFQEADRNPEDLRLRECRVELWGGCAFVNFDDSAPPLRESIEPFASYHSARAAEKMRLRWWYSAIVPANWKLAIEAFQEGYHALRTHPQFATRGLSLSPDAVYRPIGKARSASNFTAALVRSAGNNREVVDNAIHMMRTLYEGMDGMVLEKDLRIAERLRETIKLPEDRGEAFAEWNRRLNELLTSEYRKEGIPIPDLTDVAKTTSANVQFCFPNFFLLPLYGNMSSYRFRPLGPESTLFELWSLTLYPEGKEPTATISTPTPMAFDDPRWPAIPPQDFANVPLQQLGLHSKGFEYMRLSSEVEGLISHFEQMIDGYLAGLDYEQLLPALQKVSGPIDVPVSGELFG